jgi:hypothetical protein
MMIEISNETVDSLFRDMLIRDYGYMIEDIKRLETREDLPKHLKEDLEHNIEFAAAFETLLRYYLPITEANELIVEMKQ